MEVIINKVQQKEVYLAPLATIAEIKLEQNYLQATGSSTVDPGFGGGGNDGGW